MVRKIPRSPADVKDEVARIRTQAADPEGCHWDWDHLYRDVLRQIATGNPDGPAMAKEALKLERAGLTRWWS